MTGLERKNMATEILRQKAGGDISDDLEWTEDDVLNIMDSYIMQYLASAMSKLTLSGRDGRSVINEMWLVPHECKDILEECNCGKTMYYYDMTFNTMIAPKDGGIHVVKYGSGCAQNKASRSSLDASSTYLPSIEKLKPLSYYFVGNRIYFTKKAKKTSIYYLPIPSEVPDDKLVPLIPEMEGRLRIDTMAEFLGISEAKDRKGGNMIDSKE